MESRFKMPDITWSKAYCRVCGEEYDYMAGTKEPPTCKDPICQYKYAHSIQPETWVKVPKNQRKLVKRAKGIKREKAEAKKRAAKKRSARSYNNNQTIGDISYGGRPQRQGLRGRAAIRFCW